MDDQEKPTQPPPERKTRILPLLFGGAGGAVLAVVVGALLHTEKDSTLITTTTVRGPTVTQYEPLSLSTARPCSGTKVAGGPPYEPNNSIAEAYGPLKAGQPLDASLGNPHEQTEGPDEDFYAFCLAQVATLSVQLKKTGCEPETSTFETQCSELQEELINNSGESIETAEVGETTQATITDRLRPGRYYVRVHGGNGPEYELEVSTNGPPLVPAVPPL